MRNRFLLFSSALFVFTIAILLYEAQAGAPGTLRLLDHNGRRPVLPLGAPREGK
jgi:hypothetical protein